MTSLTGYIQGLGNGAKRTVEKSGKEIRLSVFDDIDNVIVLNEAGETSQKTLTGKNLFNKDDSSLILLGFLEGSFVNSATSKTICLPVFPNTTYTVSKIQSQRFRIASSPTIPTSGMSVNNFTRDDTATSLTITTGASDNYLLAFVYNSNYDTLPLDEVFATVQIEKGSTATAYEPYCGGKPSPNPDYPQDIKGIGRKQLDGTYSVSIDYDDGDERSGRITASGLAYPLYEGDILDFVNGKVIRANGYKVFDGTENWTTTSGRYALPIDDMSSGYYQVGFCNRFIRELTYSSPENCIRFGTNNKYILCSNINIEGVTNVATWKTWLSNNETYIVYPLATPTEERITLSGDITDIGTATVEADGNLTVKYDKVQMAIRKFSSPPDWDDIGYESTPIEVLNAFDYAEDIKDNWNGVRSFYGDKNLYFFPAVDMTESRSYGGMFQNTNLMHIDPITIGEETPTGNANASSMFRNTFIESASITALDDTQNFEFSNAFADCINLKSATIEAKASTVVYMFGNCPKLTTVNDTFDTSDITQFNEMFSGCTSLAVVPEIDTSSGTNFYRCFKSCANLKFAPTWDLSKATDLGQMFWDCPNLENVPFYRIPRVTNLNGMFQATGNKLTENSRNNILMMCISATAYTGTKTLAQLAFNSSMYSASSWQSLAKYADFVDAGWSIGYT